MAKKTKPLKITCVIPELNHGLFYQRLRIPFKKLDPAKYSVHFTVFDDVFLQRDESTDIFVFAHPSCRHEPDIIHELKARGKRVVVDIDDLLTDPPVCHPEADMLTHCKWTVPDVLMHSDWIVASTPSLASAYKHFNKNFSIIENALDTDLIPVGYKPKKKPYKTTFTAGWVGGQTHVGDQYEFAFGLDKFLEKHDDSRAYFRPIAPQFLVNKYGVRCHVEQSCTHYLDYAAWMGTMPWDVCLVGLVEHPFNDCKSDLRFIECARHSIPIIASPRADFVKHIEGSYALGAKDNEEFFNQLEFAKENPDLMEMMGKSAMFYVMEKRQDKHAAAKWDTVFQEVMAL